MPTWSERVSDVVPKVKNEASTGQLISVAVVVIAGAIAWGTSQADLKALAQRVESGEKRDDKTQETLGEVKGNIIELKSDNRSIKSDLERQGRQLDRIENLLRNMPPQPQPAPPPR